MYTNKNVNLPRDDDRVYLYNRVQSDIKSGRGYASQSAQLEFTPDGRAFFAFTGRWTIRIDGHSYGTAESKTALLNGWI